MLNSFIVLRLSSFYFLFFDQFQIHLDHCEGTSKGFRWKEVLLERKGILTPGIKGLFIWYRGKIIITGKMSLGLCVWCSHQCVRKIWARY